MSEFRYSTIRPTLESSMMIKMLFKHGDLSIIEVKFGDEVLMMSSAMFFAIFGEEAFDMYEKASVAFQEAFLNVI